MAETDLGKVRIENPIDGGCFILKRRAAQRHVDAGRARWTSKTTIQFIEDDYRCIAARKRAAELETARGYEARGIMTVSEIRNLPCLKPIVLITRRTKKTKTA
ncbi:MAG: hypothetical protein WAN65_19210 [Candidatus Sulfotelmatobacter sp.]